MFGYFKKKPVQVETVQQSNEPQTYTLNFKLNMSGHEVLITIPPQKRN